MKIVTSDMQFCFNKTIYSQIDGVAMGSPLGPTLANILSDIKNPKLLMICLHRLSTLDTLTIV